MHGLVKHSLCFNQADYNNMRLFVQHKLSKLDSSSVGAGTMWSTFRDILHEAIDKYVPRTQINNKRKKPLWMTGKVLRSVRK